MIDHETLAVLEHLGVTFRHRAYLLATGETIGLEDMLGLPFGEWDASFLVVWPLDSEPGGTIELCRQRFLIDAAFRGELEDAYLTRQEAEFPDDHDWSAGDDA